MALEKILKVCVLSLSLILSSCNYNLSERVSTKKAEPNDAPYLTKIDHYSMEEIGRFSDN